MPKRHRKFSAAIIIIATLSLPLFSDAFFEEALTASAASLGSILDQSIDGVAEVAKRQHQMLRSPP